MQDPFAKYHPAVGFMFFAGAFACSMLTSHPLYLLWGVGCAMLQLALMMGRKMWKVLGGTIPLFLLIAAVNPLFNTRGNTVLFMLMGRPYTLEALAYGVSIALAFVMVMLWFGSYNMIITGDKFIGLFAGLIPQLSFLLVMVFRMISGTARKAAQISNARAMIGKGGSERERLINRVRQGMVILGALTSLSLEDSVVTGDSMRARGYGGAKRSSFMNRRFTLRDGMMMMVLAAFFGVFLILNVLGFSETVFLPEIRLAEPTGVFWTCFAAYGVYLLIPAILTIKEDVQWYISRSGI